MKDLTQKKKWKKGFVILLDVLGVRNRNKKKTDKFLHDFETLWTKSESLKILLTYPKARTIMCELSGLHHLSDDIELIIFGDTILISFKVNEDGSQQAFFDNLLYISAFLSDLLVFGIMSKNLRFRGAISYGDYCVSERNILLGPALNEAAEWYEQAKWMGVMMTPQLSFLCDERICLDSLRECDNEMEWLLKTNIPTKRGLLKDIWALNWPQYFLSLDGMDKEPNKANKSKQLFMVALGMDKAPKQSADIFSNTYSFFNESISNFLKKEVQPSFNLKELTVQLIEKLDERNISSES